MRSSWLDARPDASGRSIGIFLDYALTPRSNILADVVIQASTAVSGYSLPYFFASGHSPGDGDTVGVCALEPAPRPAACD